MFGRETAGQREVLPPLIKRKTPEGKDYRIVIPSNVEYIIRKFCSKAPNNEWSGTLFYIVEGSFETDSFKIICKDFLLMDLGSQAFTEFDEDGTAIDYMAQHPELLDCQMGLLHSHDTMSTFFSGTDTNTLNKEGNDRNNFVSLIVNNAGEYSAAVTRKVKYHEIHNIELRGEYPFFGSRTMFATESSFATEEKTKDVIEWFDLVVEKETVEFSEDEYDARFMEIFKRKTTPKSNYYGGGNLGRSPYYPSYQGYGGYGRGFYGGLKDDDDDDDDNTVKQLPQKTGASENKPAKTTIEDIMLTEGLDPEELKAIKDIPALTYRVKQLAYSIITGCPVISRITNKGSVLPKDFEEVFKAFEEEKYTARMYEAFISSSLETIFGNIEVTEYFPDHIVEGECMSDPMLENVLLIKVAEAILDSEASALALSAISAILDFYAI